MVLNLSDVLPIIHHTEHPKHVYGAGGSEMNDFGHLVKFLTLANSFSSQVVTYRRYVAHSEAWEPFGLNLYMLMCFMRWS